MRDRGPEDGPDPLLGSSSHICFDAEVPSAREVYRMALNVASKAAAMNVPEASAEKFAAFKLADFEAAKRTADSIELAEHKARALLVVAEAMAANR